MMYSAVFDTASTLVDYGTITLTRAGKPDVVVDLQGLAGPGSSTLLYHYDSPNSSLGVYPDWYFISEDLAQVQRRTEISISPFEKVLALALQAGASAQGWTNPTFINITFSRTTGQMSIFYPLNFTIAWSTAAGRALCGFLANQSTPNTGFAGSVPSYVILPTQPATSDSTPNFEPDEVASHAVSDSGESAGITGEVAPLLREWVQQYELKAKVMRENAATTHPETFEGQRQYCRTVYPFLVLDGFGDSFDEVFLFTGPSSSWKPARRSRGDDVQFHIPFQCIVIGKVVVYPS